MSAAPARTVELRTVLVDDSHGQLVHDLDRLSVTILTDVADITVGRQAITWGLANVFPVADLWAQFSPFELDTEEKPGFDAIRALMYPGGDTEIDIVVGDRGSRRDLSFGMRATTTLADADVYAGVGKFWRQVMGMAGVSAVAEVSIGKCRADSTRLLARGILPAARDCRACSSVSWLFAEPGSGERSSGVVWSGTGWAG